MRTWHVGMAWYVGMAWEHGMWAWHQGMAWGAWHVDMAWVGRSTRISFFKKGLGRRERVVEKVHIEPVTTQNKIKLQTRAI